jgi:hypothetical protein
VDLLCGDFNNCEDTIKDCLIVIRSKFGFESTYNAKEYVRPLVAQYKGDSSHERDGVIQAKTAERVEKVVVCARLKIVICVHAAGDTGERSHGGRLLCSESLDGRCSELRSQPPQPVQLGQSRKVPFMFVKDIKIQSLRNCVD